jgi:hypothetical protein
MNTSTDDNIGRPHDAGLSVEIDNAVLKISIGVSVLCFAATLGPYFDRIVAEAGGAEIRITDENSFAAAILHELRREKEDGTTLVHRMLDEAAERAVEDGAEGIELPASVWSEPR